MIKSEVLIDCWFLFQVLVGIELVWFFACFDLNFGLDMLAYDIFMREIRKIVTNFDYIIIYKNKQKLPLIEIKSHLVYKNNNNNMDDMDGYLDNMAVSINGSVIKIRFFFF